MAFEEYFVGGLAEIPIEYLTETEANALYKGIGYVPSWSQILNIPATFPPSSHTHVDKADLVSGKVPTSQLPAVRSNDTFTISTQAAMLALSADQGDVAIRSDQQRAYRLLNDSPTILANWVALPVPADVVQSINGQQGIVVLSAADVGARPSTYVPSWTEITQKPVSFPPSSHGHTSTDLPVATQVETDSGVSNTKLVTPAGLQGRLVIPPQNAAAPLSSYPLGVSLFNLNDLGGGLGWQEELAVITTLRYANGEGYQSRRIPGGGVQPYSRQWRASGSVWESWSQDGAGTFSISGHLHNPATAVANGFMSAADKSKLDAGTLLSSLEKTRLDTLGYAAFNAYQSTQDLDIPTSVPTRLLFQTETLDPDFRFSASRWTPGKIGQVLVGGKVTITPCVDLRLIDLRLYKNGVLERVITQTNTSGTGAQSTGGLVVADCPAISTYFDLYIFHNFGVSTSDIANGISATRFEGVMISP